MRAHILVVDDTRDNLRLLSNMLTEQGYKVRPVSDGRRAISSAQNRPPDLILLDIMMPGMDGYEVCERLKADERTKKIPVIFLSALNETMDKVRAFRIGGVDYITKPFQAEEVLARVETHLNLRNTQKQLEEQNIRLHQEISERKRAEEGLLKLQKAVETTEVGVTITDNDGRIVYTNPADANMHGYSVDELIGQPSNIFASLEFRDSETRLYQNFEAFHNWERERMNVRKDGSVFPVNLVSNPIYDTTGKRIGIVTICEDITERKHVEEELKHAKEAAEEAQRAAEAANRAKSTFLANMSHELRSPLNAILGFAQILTHTPHTPEETKYLSIIQRSGEHLLTLINQVLDLSKIEAGRITLNAKNFDLHRLLHDVEDMFALKADNKHLHLLFEWDDRVPQYVCTDDVKLRQVLINLLNNAMKFTEEGNISLRVYEFNELDELPTQKLKNSKTQKLCFEISDTGPGIAPEEIDTVFEAFGQTETGRQTQEGTGLGLPISRKFVQMMGGDMQVTSAVGQGTTFTFDIQVNVVDVADMDTGALTRRVIVLEPGQPRYRMLIVDDNVTHRQLLITLLKPFELELREAKNGQEAIDIWDTWEPHLIWMDIRMPGLDGYEATKRIREAEEQKSRRTEKQKSRRAEEQKLDTGNSILDTGIEFPVSSDQRPASSIQHPASSDQYRTPIIAVTASSYEEERAMILSVGCDDYLRKPFKEADVFEILHKHLGIRFVYEERETSKVESRKSKVEEGLRVEALAALPAEWLADLKQGAEEVDVELLFSTIEQIRERDAAVAEALAQWIDDFEYENILNMIQQIGKGVME